VTITAAQVHTLDDGYEIALDITGKQFEASGDAAEHEVLLDTWFQQAVFPESDRALIELQPLHLSHHRLHSVTTDHRARGGQAELGE
jgi:hypothetical protein